MKTPIILVFCFFLVCTSAQSQNITIDDRERVSIGNKVSHYLDKSKIVTIHEAEKINKFEKSKVEVPNFGIARGNVWIKLVITNKTNQSNYLLEIAQPTLDEVVFYDTELDTSIVQGDKFPFYQRDHNFNHFVFELNVKPEETKTYFLKVNSSNQVQIPIYLGPHKKIEQSNQQLNIVMSLFLGLMIAMILYNFVIYFFIRDNSYLYYVLYISILMFTQLTPHGFTFQFFWPESPVFTQYSMFLFPISVGVTGILFFNSFLQTKRFAPKIIWIFRLLFILYFVAIILVITNELKSAYMLIDFTAMTVALTMIVGAIMILKRGNKTALYFLLAWSIFLVGIVLWVLKDTGVLPFNNYTNYTMLLGAGIETILLSIGLANRINVYRKENEQSKLNEIKVLKENKRLISEQNILLEKKVKERTTELEQVNSELENALESVIKAQNKLLESEKMASLGQLTAGIAHEINNPINFVSSNIEPLKRDLKDIEMLLDKYEEINEENIIEKLKEVKEFRDEIELPYLKKELSDIINNIEEGARRTSEIVKGLKTFSRDDQKSKVAAQVNSGLESSLTLVQNKLDHINTIVELGELPQIMCYPGKLNQAFMNIIVNSIDAVKSKFGNKDGGEISIKSVYNKQDETVVVTIKDNGIGIPQKIINKVYDPFYTTKEIGKGTGLGLSIVYKIIEIHSGDIKLDSEEGKGTTFSLKIPVNS
ncbi:MAG: 7TM diverse intracellular signaling domain-containing protein [Brumimicrobium sp.]